MTDNIFDLAIIGTGTMGAAGAYFASQAGLSVAMIDANTPPHTHGSHHGDSRLFRYLYDADYYQALLIRAKALWQALEQEHGVELIKRCGVLNIANKDSQNLIQKTAMAEKYQLPYRLLSAQEIMQTWPNIALNDMQSGLLETEAGYIHAEKSIDLFIEKSLVGGAQAFFNQPVKSIDAHDDHVEIHTNTQTIRAKKTVLSAGTWVNQIAMAHTVPIKPLRKVFTWYHAPQTHHQQQGFPGFTFELKDGIYYGFPDAGSGLKIGRHDEGEWMNSPSEQLTYGAYQSDEQDTSNMMAQHLPQVLHMREGKVCSYDMSEDEDFIIDDNLYGGKLLVLSGFSGHGFKFAPVIGEIIAEFAQNRPSSFDLSAFAMQRLQKTHLKK